MLAPVSATAAPTKGIPAQRIPLVLDHGSGLAAIGVFENTEGTGACPVLPMDFPGAIE